MIVEWVSAVSNVVMAVAAAVGLRIAWVQLSGLKEQLSGLNEGIKMSSLMAILEIEAQMNDRKVHWDECIAKLRIADAEGKTEAMKEILGGVASSAKENYFNSLDRLCFCILKDYLKDRENKDWRTDYRDMLKETIENNEGDFGAASPYRNIIKLNDKWRSE